MGVSNVYNQAKANAIAAIKSNMAAKGTKKAEALKPEHLTMTGSIFNAPGAKNTQPTPTLTDLNTTASLAELNKKPVAQAQGKGSNSKNPDSFADIDNVADGKAAANSVSAQGDKVKAYTAKTEQQAGVVARLGSNSAQLYNQIEDANKKFNAQNVKLQAQIKSDNIRLEIVAKKNEQLQEEVDDAQNELNTLLARNSFSMGGSQGSGSSDDQAKITELQTIIGSKVGSMQANGKVIYSLQRSQNRTLNSMQRTNNAYIKTHQRNTKALQNSQAEDSKIIKVATEVEKYSALAQAGGQMLSLAGRGLVALGSAMSGTGFGSAVGAALIATGQVMGKIGTVVEMVGQYGQAAANITKTAAYAAEGNIMGAMQSAASAVQMGCAAAKSTTGLKNAFKAIDQTATEATNKLAAKTIANETVNNMDESQLGGMTKKEAKKAMAANLQEQFNNGGIDGVTSTHNQNGRLKQLKAAANKDEALSSAQTDFENSVTKAGGKIENGVVTGLDKKTRKQVGKQAKTSFGNIKKSSTKSSTNWADNMNKFTQSFSSMAQMFGMMGMGGNMMGGSMMGSGYNNMGYMSNGMSPTTMTDKQRRAAWQQRNAKALGKTAKS